MGNIVEFLARVGRDASLRHASSDVLDQEMMLAGISSEVRAAVAAGNSDDLRRLRGHEVFFSSLMPDGPDEEKDDDDRQDDDKDDDGDEKRSTSSEPHSRP